MVESEAGREEEQVDVFEGREVLAEGRKGRERVREEDGTVGIAAKSG